jgi:hypothetical protein
MEKRREEENTSILLQHNGTAPIKKINLRATGLLIVDTLL